MVKKQLLLSLVASIGLIVLVALPAHAQTPPCAASGAPQCDGECGPTQACIDTGGGICGCVEVAGEACGLTAGPPECWGACPPAQACVYAGGICECQVVPTLSEWGIIGMSLAMLGLILYRRREFDGA